ncbi:AAA family ATPase [Aerococcus urinaehominis]|uniref:AAA family ATPase n=1 Tax=Aerococcus urinaehominis TaxID=128944 RepID=A0A109RH26_9LACT|nr:RNA-binding domain-containing protein [Aerococcus urinaehominis]AMB99863.1 AAA family ATPase [Aerococcus urinaehominis]SDM54152.1 ATP-dependent DNA helicase RecG [Aerococcus urinaehominis]
MKEKDLLNLVEGKGIELKKAEGGLPKSLWETYSAFANTDGGIIYLGIDEKEHKVTGLKNPDKIREDLFNTANNPHKVSYNLLTNDNVDVIYTNSDKAVLKIVIPEAPYQQKPVYINNNPDLSYERLGEGDRKLSPNHFKALVVGSQKETDSGLLKNYDISDLNEEDLLIYREELYQQTKQVTYRTMDFHDMLVEVGALRKDRQGDGSYYLTEGGLLFFGKYNAITDRFPGFQIDYFEKQNTMTSDWIDRVSTGDAQYPQLNIYSFLRIVLDKLQNTIKDQFKVDQQTQQRLPFKKDLSVSVREALINSLMHAYYDSNQPIKITSYPDYYEFENPGKMRVTVDEFINGGHSDIRNHTISNMMRRIGYSEKAGSGGPRIIDTVTKYQLKFPEILRGQYHTNLRIWKVDLEKTFEDYTEEQQQILYYLIEKHSISSSEAVEVFGITGYAFRKTIGELINLGIVEKLGGGRSTRYVLLVSESLQNYKLKRMLRGIEDRISNPDLY